MLVSVDAVNVFALRPCAADGRRTLRLPQVHVGLHELDALLLDPALDDHASETIEQAVMSNGKLEEAKLEKAIEVIRIIVPLERAPREFTQLVLIDAYDFVRARGGRRGHDVVGTGLTTIRPTTKSGSLHLSTSSSSGFPVITVDYASLCRAPRTKRDPSECLQPSPCSPSIYAR
jgi:hypothetical protein